MPALQIVEVIIGLLFIYLAICTICSIVTEVIAMVLGLRHRGLIRGLKLILLGPAFSKDNPWWCYLIQPLKSLNKTWSKHDVDKGIVEDFLDEFFIRNLSDKHNLSKIPPKTFTLALFSLLNITFKNDFYGNFVYNKQSNVQGDKKTLYEKVKIIIDLSNHKTNQVFTNIEEWYYSTMTMYITQLYRFWTRIILFFLGLVFAASLNLDFIMITRELWVNSLTNKILQGQIDNSKQSTSSSTQTLYKINSTNDSYTTSVDQTDFIIKRIYHNNLLIGWENDECDNINPRTVPNEFWGWLGKILGILSSALIISLGANHWFDLICKVLKANKGS